MNGDDSTSMEVKIMKFDENNHQLGGNDMKPM